MIESFLISSLCGFISFLLIITMIKIKIKRKEVRKLIVKAYKLLIVCSCICMIFSVSFMLFYLYAFVYIMIYRMGVLFSNNIEFAKYISLAVILITIQPGVYLILKMLKKKLYYEAKIKEMQGVATDLINKIIFRINSIPIKGIIHIVNLILVVLANSYKVLNIDTNLTTTSIYMSVATFYALDKVVDYFAKKYSNFWNKIDNKFFETEKINEDVEFGLNNLNNIKETIFSKYIETGQYGL